MVSTKSYRVAAFSAEALKREIEVVKINVFSLRSW